MRAPPQRLTNHRKSAGKAAKAVQARKCIDIKSTKGARQEARGNMANPDMDPSAPKALRACRSCKSRKRKCDKSLPVCTLCRSKGWVCEYALPGHPSPESNSSFGKSSISEITSYAVERVDFPAVFFLDYEMFRKGRLEIPKPGVSIPQHIRDLNGDAHQIRASAADYFQHLHNSLPFISKTRFYEHLLNPLSPPRADVALLILSMRTISSPPEANPAKAPMYVAAKQFFSDLLGAGVHTLQLLQAGVLLSLYELGHAIFPTAYLSIGICARYGCSLGLNGQGGSDMYDSPDWLQIEERKRAWWTVLILDRYSNLGNPSRALATLEPESSSILPIDDDAWNKGVIPSSPSFALCSPSSIHMGRFARFAQACHLLGLALRHHADISSDNKQSTSEFREQEAAQIRRTLIALIKLSKAEAEIRKLEFCTQTAVCYSALMLLDYPTMADTQLAWQAFEDLGSPARVANTAESLCRNFLDTGLPPTRYISPFLLHYVYRTCAIFLEMYRTTGDEKAADGAATLRDTLRLLDHRWKSAGAYLDILKAREVIHSW